MSKKIKRKKRAMRRSPVNHSRAVRSCREAFGDLLGHEEGRESVDGLALQSHVAVCCEEGGLDRLEAPSSESQRAYKSDREKRWCQSNRRCVKLVGVPCHEGFVALPYLQGLDQTLLDLSRLSSAERISAGKD